MKIIKVIIDKKKRNGYAIFMPIDEEDIWYTYNIIMVGDIIRIATLRKIVHQKGSEFSVKSTERKLIPLMVRVLDIMFQADDKGTSLMMKTKNLSENQYVMKGQIQTVQIQLNQKIQVIKERWDYQSEEFLKEAGNLALNVDSIIVLIDEGYAGFYTLKRNFIKLHGKVKKSMPKKKTSIMDIYNKKLEEFDIMVWRYLFESFENLEKIQAVILAGPGNSRLRIFNKLKKIDEFEKNEVLRKAIRVNVHKFASIQTSTTFKSSISEIVKDKTGAKLLADTKAVMEMRKLEEFYNIFMKNSNLGVFGEKEVRFAHENDAIKTLLITDGLLRSKNYIVRKKMLALVDSIREKGAEIYMFNENHDSGARLKDITGIAATLKFPLDLEILRDNEQSADQSENQENLSNQSFPDDEIDENFFDDNELI